MFSDYTKNFLIYYNNLSTYYIICVIMSIAAIILSWIYHFKKVPVELDDDEDANNAKMNKNEVNAVEENDDENDVISTFKKSIKQHSIDQMAANLTEEQLMEEKEAEKNQLAAILELLKQQEEKFQVGSMEELEGQLKLYR